MEAVLAGVEAVFYNRGGVEGDDGAGVVFAAGFGGLHGGLVIVRELAIGPELKHGIGAQPGELRELADVLVGTDKLGGGRNDRWLRHGGVAK